MGFEEMGKIININITKSSIYEDVRRETSYIGSKSMSESDTTSYIRIHASVDDEKMLDVFFADSVISVNAILHRYIKESIDIKDGYNVVLCMNKYWDERKGGQEESIKSLFVNSILGAWLNYVKKDDSQIYQQKAADIALLLKENVDSRVMPSKKREERIDTCVVIERI